MTSPQLFTPVQVGPLTVRNRAWVPPMCQYSVETRDGVVADWHLVQYGNLAASGWGMVVTEATAVSPEGRISPWDAGLWGDEHVAPWRRITDFCHEQGAAVGVQLAHAGRKASTHRWFAGAPAGNVPVADGGWLPVGPTASRVPGDEYTADVTALDEAGIRKVVADFGAAARRAAQAGFDAVEVHAAHGYLLHQFCSPLSNTRTDAWGGSLENRTRLVVDVVDAVRAAFDGALLVRISATDWIDGGWDVEQSVWLASLLREHGVHLVDVSSGGLEPAPVPVGPGYQVPLAEQVRAGAGVATSAVGLITSPSQAEQLLVDGRCDAVMLGRQALREPTWPLRAAHELGVAAADAPWAPARWRGQWH